MCPRGFPVIQANLCMYRHGTRRAMSIPVPDMRAYVVTGVQLDDQNRVVRVRWYLADGLGEAGLATAPRPITDECVVDTLEVVDKLLDAEPVLPLFGGSEGVRFGAAVKVHVQPDGTESIEVDPPLPGQRLRDLPHF